MKPIYIFSFIYLFLYHVNSAQIPRGICKTRTGEILREGEEWRDPHHCSIYMCSVYEGEAVLDGLTCPSFWIPAGCKQLPGKGRYYPDCCPTAACPQSFDKVRKQ